LSTLVHLETLKNKGYKLTPQRRLIIELVNRSDRRLNASEIHAYIEKKHPRISLDTVYRNLRLLAELGIVHQIPLQSGMVYESAVTHHHHLVCVDCGKVACLHYCPDYYAYSKQAETQGFEVLGHKFEVQGRCPSCKIRD